MYGVFQMWGRFHNRREKHIESHVLCDFLIGRSKLWGVEDGVHTIAHTTIGYEYVLSVQVCNCAVSPIVVYV